jgi:hypothetical protein
MAWSKNLVRVEGGPGVSRRAEFVAYLRRTEGRLAALAVLSAASAILVGVLGVLSVQSRLALLDDAVERRGALTAAALDVYRTFADADASSLDAVLVEPARATDLQRRHREDVFDAADALREAAARDPGGATADRIRQLADLVPDYVRLVETGWTDSHANLPVGTSYLAQASSLVRGTILTTAADLYRDQTTTLAAAQRDAGQPAWVTFAAGALALVVLVATQRFVFRRTRRRFNPSLAAATLLTAMALVWFGIALAVVAGDADDSAGTRGDLVAPLAQARNLGREADGDEARMLIFPRLGDVGRLRDNLDRIERLIGQARGKARPGAERDQIDQAAAALRSWRASDRILLDQPNPPPTYREVADLITGIPPNAKASYPAQLDQHLTAAIDSYAEQASAATASARRALTGLDVIIGGLTVVAAGAAVAGLRPRIAEYYR